MDELFSAVIATSLVKMCVFLPVLFFPGATGNHLQAVRGHDHLLDRDLDVQRADVFADALGLAAEQ